MLLTFTTIVMSVIVTGTISVSAALNGECGENLTWVLDDNGTLTISGQGEMLDYSLINPAPWLYVEINVENVVIGDGVTSLGDYAFTMSSIAA